MSTLGDWTPRPRPARAPLTGRYARLEPLDPARHGDALFSASMAPGAAERFRFLGEAPMERGDFDAWMRRAAASDDPLMFAVVERATGMPGGRQAFLRITPEHGVLEVGAILWGPAIARTRIATEALYLFARHAFDDLGYRRLEWKCNANNVSSRQAASRFGFRFEGIFRNHMVVKGNNRDTAWYALIDEDWPTLAVAFQAWLDPANFDAAGRQKTKLCCSPAG